MLIKPRTLVELHFGMKKRFLITSKTFFQLVILDTPEHEDDWCDDREDESVGEMSVQRQLDQVSTKTKGPGGLNEGRKDPPANGTENNLNCCVTWRCWNCETMTGIVHSLIAKSKVLRK